MKRGEIWWVNLREPIGSEPGYRRPVLIVSSDSMNCSWISTILTAVLTTNLNLAAAPANVFVSAEELGLTKDSIVNVSQLVTVDKDFFSDYIGELNEDTMIKVDEGLRLALFL